MTRSRIYLSDRAVNTERKFGAALSYVPVRIVRTDINGDATIETALFTHDALMAARQRGAINPEDVPPIGRWERFCIAWSVLWS